MRIQLTFLIMLSCLLAKAQPLSNDNLAHQYDPLDELDFKSLMVKQDGRMIISYSLFIAQNSSPELFLLEWEERDSYSQRKGNTIRTDSLILSGGERKQADFAVELKDDAWILLLRITKITNSKSWSYPFLIERNYPVNGFIKEGENRILTSFLKTGRSYTIEGPPGKPNLYGYYYSNSFQSAFPPFSKSTAGADPLLIHDSTFTIVSKSPITFSKEGLYLFQSDTSSSEGFAVRVVASSFPKYTKIEDLVEPLVFICTKEEFDQLQLTKGDKVAFDKTIMEITRDRDRAKKFMKSYYNQVELANQYFSSYKEGWKTDKGMIFIVFGIPDEIRKTGQNEIWYYKNSRTKFIFLRKGSVYDPDYTVLMRDSRYTELWYNAIDLWRKSRY